MVTWYTVWQSNCLLLKHMIIDLPSVVSPPTLRLELLLRMENLNTRQRSSRLKLNWFGYRNAQQYTQSYIQFQQNMIANCVDIKCLGMVCSTELHLFMHLLHSGLYTVAHNIMHDWKSVPVGWAMMPILVLNHLGESSVKSSTLSLTNSLDRFRPLFI